MKGTNTRYSRLGTRILVNGSPSRLIISCALTLAFVLIAMDTFTRGMAYAAPRPGNVPGNTEGDAANEESVTAGREDNAPVNSEQRGRRLKVWSANLAVGEISESGITYFGYTSDLDPTLGDLDDTAFNYSGVDYTVPALFEQNNGFGFQQIILYAGARLPDELILKLDDHTFPVATENVHSWVMDSSLGWTEGQTVEARLLGPRISDPCLTDSCG